MISRFDGGADPANMGYESWHSSVYDELIMTREAQLALWVDGESVHNGASEMEGECCPDFSCCLPSVGWTIEKRREFAENYKLQQERARSRKELEQIHPGNRLRLMAGLPLLPDDLPNVKNQAREPGVPDTAKAE